MIDKAHDKAIAAFWASVDTKLVGPPSYRSMINYMLSRMPTWLVIEATRRLKDWKA